MVAYLLFLDCMGPIFQMKNMYSGGMGIFLGHIRSIYDAVPNE